MNVPFVDLRPMHDEIRKNLNEAFNSVLEKSIYIDGENCEKFESDFAKYCGVEHCVGVGNGLDALTLILRAIGIGAGDEVIVPANTYIATALAVSQCGAKPVLVDPEIDTYNIDPKKIEDAITNRTRVIMPVHLQGRCANMDAINEIAKRHGLYVIEDAAQAQGTMYKGKIAGTMGDAAGVSFYPGKNLGALGDGGCVLTDDDNIATRVSMLKNYGQKEKYDHVLKGVNSRLDEIQAAFLRAKLPNLDKWNSERRRIAGRYFEAIKNADIVLPRKSDEEYEHIYHVFAIRHERRDELESYLNEKGIGTLKHYPIPIHLQKAYSDMGYKKGDYPIAEEISETILSIPMYYGMSDDEIDYVIDALNGF